MRKVVNFCDYFVICSATSERRIGAIANGIDEGLLKSGIALKFRPKEKESHWMLLDTGDVIVHIFSEEMREFYNLEYLWQDAPRINLKK